MVPNDPKWSKMVKKKGEKCSKWSKSPKMIKIAKNDQNCQKWSKLPKMVKMVQNGPKWSKRVPKDPNGKKW